MTDSFKEIEGLSPKKRELFRLLLKERSRGAARPPITPRRRGEHPSLSFAQQRLWFLSRLRPDSAAYNIPFVVQLVGKLDVAALQRSLQEVTRRHEVLRTNFQTLPGGRVVQVIHPRLEVRLPVVGLEGMDEASREEAAWEMARREARRPFDLTRDALLRVSLLRLGDERHMLLLTMHHIVSDGWSIGILVREAATLYEAFSSGLPSPLPELPCQYADYAEWQQGWLRGEVLEEQLSYWRKQLAGASEALALPTDRPRPSVQGYHGAVIRFGLPLELSRAVNALGRGEGATLFMTLLAAWKALLHRFTGQDAISVGSPIAGRNRAEIEGLIGCFINTLVMRTDVSGNPSFRGLLGRVREVCIGAYAHQDVPFEKLVEELHPDRSRSRPPLFQVWFVLQNTFMPVLEMRGLKLSCVSLGSATAQFDLTMTMMEESDGRLTGALEYNTDIFEAETAAEILKYYETLLKNVAARVDWNILDIPLAEDGGEVGSATPSRATAADEMEFKF